MNAPIRIVAGDAVGWFDSAMTLVDGTVAGPPDWMLSYSFRGPSAAGKVDTTPVAVVGSQWQTQLTQAQTGGLNSTGAVVVWYWQAYVTDKAGNRKLIGEGQMDVKPNLQALTTVDGRSPAAQILQKIKDAIATRAAGGLVQDYSIGTRNLRREPVAGLLALKSHYEGIVARERAADSIANGLGNPNMSFARFTRR